MEFGIKKCGVIVLKRGKLVSSEEVEMPDGERIKEVEENGCKYLGIRIQQNQENQDEGKLSENI